MTEPIENDHLMKWIDMGRAEELFLEHHVWAVKRWLELKPQ
ncbi:hypothetical protein [Paenibacillus vulneris]|uniref:Uncharacterized protein n=1 Tax=Paenibacillus vulneris TaxID=1133364 RepID=A0ABW3UWK7_9BACL